MRSIHLWVLCLTLLLAPGCGQEPPAASGSGEPSGTVSQAEPSQSAAYQPEASQPGGAQSTSGLESASGLESDSDQGSAAEQASKPEPRVVVLDAGHQGKANRDKEPVGPGASETKAKVSSGTQGRFTGVPEYQVNLEVTLQLRDELESRGYEVILTRESNDVDISNAQRAALANEAQAGAFVRIHCNGSEDPSVHGAFTICPTPDNPYPVREIYRECRSLADEVLDGLVEATGAQKRKVWETDTMSGLNWCEVPSIIVEMGYMTNREEDNALASPEYQAKLVQGIANGIDRFFALQESE